MLCDIIDMCRVFCGGLGWWFFLVLSEEDINLYVIKEDVFIDKFVLKLFGVMFIYYKGLIYFNGYW